MTVALVVTVLAWAAVTVATARPPSGPVPTFDAYLGRWSVAHEGYDARGTRLLRGWLRLVYALARPLARAGVQPDVVTVWTIWLALSVVVLTAAGGAAAVAAAFVLVVSGLGDALDGAVAVLTGRTTRWGYVLDSVVDRANDGLFVVAAWTVGAPAWLAVACGAAFGLLEYLRARAGNAGMHHVDVITVGERPVRVICCALAVGSAGIVPARATELAGLSLVVLLVLSVAGLVQLGVAVRGRLTSV